MGLLARNCEIFTKMENNNSGITDYNYIIKKKIELNVTEREKTREKKKSFPRKSLTVFQNTRDFFPGLIEDP